MPWDEEPIDEETEEKETDENDYTPYVNNRATALYSAGFLYGFSKHEIDRLTEIYGCFIQTDKGDTILQNAYAEFAKGEFKKADDQMVLFLHEARHGVRDCSHEVRQRFGQIDYDRNRFFSYPTSQNMFAFNLAQNEYEINSLYA